MNELNAQLGKVDYFYQQKQDIEFLWQLQCFLHCGSLVYLSVV